MKNRRPMRSWFWYFVLVAVVAMFVYALVRCLTQGFDSLGDAVWGFIVGPLYVLAFVFVPKMKFLQPVSTAPAVSPEENTPLAVPARLTIIRDSSVAGMAAANTVFLDNAAACSIKNGGSAVVTLTMKHSVLRINAVGSPNVRLEVTAPDGGVGEVHMKGGVFLPRTLKWNDNADPAGAR